MALGWLFHSRTQHAGASSAVEAISLGVQLAGRRERVLAGGERVLIDSLAEKVLHAWLQNRHQTLFPLTINFRTLSDRQGAVLAAWMAVALLATTDADRVAQAGQEASNWLASAGARPATLNELDAALADPPALDRAVAAVAEPGLPAYAYVLALVATDPRDPATPSFLDYVAAKLALPTNVVRSATRRYGR